MKAADIRALKPQAMMNKLKELYQESFNLKFQQATNQLSNTARIRQVRRDIARIRTILGQLNTQQEI